LGWEIDHSSVLDPVVCAIAISMMHYLVCPERATNVQSHDKAMLPDLRHASNQGTELPRNRYLSVTMADVPVAVALPDRPIRQRAAMQQEAPVVSGAVTLGLVRAVAVIDRTQPARSPQRRLVRKSRASESQVVAMAIVARLGWLVAIRCLALDPRSIELLRRSRISRSENPSIVHLAHLQGVPRPVASVDGTGPCHEIEGIKPL
jgi:hypothetical protein